MLEIKTIDEVKYYVEKVTNNRWSYDKYTLQAANKAAESLEHCVNCIDCTDCKFCLDCVECTECKFCQFCNSCVHCVNCAECVECHTLAFSVRIRNFYKQVKE